MAVSEMGAEGAGVRPGFTFSLISTLSVTTGNDNRLIIVDKSPIPPDKDVRIQKMIIDYLSVIIDKTDDKSVMCADKHVFRRKIRKVDIISFAARHIY